MLFGEVDEAHGPTLCTRVPKDPPRDKVLPAPRIRFPTKLEANLPARKFEVTAQLCNSRPFRGGPRPQYQLTRCAIFRRPSCAPGTCTLCTTTLPDQGVEPYLCCWSSHLSQYYQGQDLVRWRPIRAMVFDIPAFRYRSPKEGL